MTRIRLSLRVREDTNPGVGANFKNTFFIAAYDRNYVIEAIKEHNPLNAEFFLEKIFQVELNLPYFHPVLLKEKLSERLKRIFPTEFHRELEDGFFYNHGKSCFNYWITTLRDITRLSNSLIINIAGIKGEVSISDFIKIELLRLKYPSVYEQLYRNSEEYLKTESNSRGKHIYLLKRFDNKEDNLTTSQDNDYVILKFLKKELSILSIPSESDVNQIIVLLNELFRKDNYNVSSLSIVYPSNFNKYFSYRLLENNLSRIEFQKYRRCGLEEFENKISEWVKNNLELEVKINFVDIKAFDDRADYEKVIRAIFFFANLKSTFGPLNIGFDYNNLMLKLSSYKTSFISSLYNEQGGEAEYKKFVYNLFYEAKPPFTYESAFLNTLLKIYIGDDSFVLTQYEAEKIIVSYLKRYCESHGKVNDHAWYLYENCKGIYWGDYGKGGTVIIKEAIDFLREFIQSNSFEKFIIDSIHKEPRSNIYLLSAFIPELYGDWETFKKHVDSLDDTAVIEEFKLFLQKYSEASFNPVAFKFYVIDK